MTAHPNLKRGRKGARRLDTGYRRSPVDIRDFRYALVAPKKLDVAVPDEYNLETPQLRLPTYNQGQMPSCVGWMGAQLKTAQERLECKRTLQFDGVEIYTPIALPCDHGIALGQPCQQCGGTSLGGGSYIREMLKELIDRGAHAVGGRKTPYTISAFAGVDPKNHAEVKHGLFTSGVLALGIEVPRFFLDGGGKEFKGGDGPGTDIVGGHAILAIGYDAEGVWLINSWGEDWADHGRIKVSWAFWDQYVTEAWTTVDVTDPQVVAALKRRKKLLKI